jgi:pimeloyl-ACP methyl ester carboxylesterase
VYYIDGAGGGSAIANWSGGVRKGLQEAGYNAFGEMFPWETGFGVLIDQAADVGYKRSRAKELVARIREHRKQCPDDPVHFIALSAGTAIAVYALEAMPDDAPADNVVLLGASISADHDLTQALRHLRGRLFIFTSPGDAVLGFFVPLTGTADREVGGSGPAGLYGFIVPPNASEETRRLYAEKVVTIPWTPQFEVDGNYGGHLDNVNPEFIRDHVAPLVMEGRLPVSPARAAMPHREEGR